MHVIQQVLLLLTLSNWLVYHHPGPAGKARCGHCRVGHAGNQSSTTTFVRRAVRILASSLSSSPASTAATHAHTYSRNGHYTVWCAAPYRPAMQPCISSIMCLTVPSVSFPLGDPDLELHELSARQPCMHDVHQTCMHGTPSSSPCIGLASYRTMMIWAPSRTMCMQQRATDEDDNC
jgi:hypothetical protein